MRVQRIDGYTREELRIVKSQDIEIQCTTLLCMFETSPIKHLLANLHLYSGLLVPIFNSLLATPWHLPKVFFPSQSHQTYNPSSISSQISGLSIQENGLQEVVKSSVLGQESGHLSSCKGLTKQTLRRNNRKWEETRKVKLMETNKWKSFKKEVINSRNSCREFSYQVSEGRKGWNPK